MRLTLEQLAKEIKRLKDEVASLTKRKRSITPYQRRQTAELDRRSVVTEWVRAEVSPDFGLLAFEDDGSIIDHGDLLGLSDDDHSLYLLKSGLREWDEQGGDPSTPASTKWKLYFKSGGLYLIDDGGTVTGPLIDAAGGVTDHGALTGLSDIADHPGYLDLAGTRAMTGDLDMGTNAITDATTIYLAVTSVSNDYTATNSDHCIFIDVTGTVTLPAGTLGKRFIVKQTNVNETAYVAGTSGEVFNEGSRLDLDHAGTECVGLEWDGSVWQVLWRYQRDTADILTTHPIMMGPDSGAGVSADGNVGVGVSWLETFSDTRNRTVAPIAGTIHSLKIEISGAAVGVGEDWTVTLYKNGSSTALTATISEAETEAEDLTNRISVAAGDTLYFNVDETGTLSNDLVISVIYESQYQPMFGNGDSGGGTRYGCVQNAQYSGSGTREFVTLFPCAGTLRNFYVDSPSCDTAGDEVTVTLTKFDAGAGTWSDTALSVVLNFNTDGSSKSDTSSSYAVSAGDILQWKYATTGGAVSRTSISCEFRPDTPGCRIITGQITTYDESDADVYMMAMGNGDDFAANTSVATNHSIAAGGTLEDLYVSTNPAPGATSKWIEVTVQKDGIDTSLTARVTDPAVSNSDTSNTVSFTQHSNDIGINVTNSGDTPDAQTWVAWGMVLR